MHICEVYHSQVDVFLEELDSIEAGHLAAIVGRQQPPLSDGGSVRHPPLARLRALARASATVIGLLDSPEKVGVLQIAHRRENAHFAAGVLY